MSEDPIKRLIKESRLETSSSFTDDLFQKFEAKQSKKIAKRLYLLTGLSILFFMVITLMLMKPELFGLSLELPKNGLLMVISLLGFLTVLHLINLIKNKNLILSN
ncbi:hypothetical protein [Roseivirga misakiensis]|uniref:Uncharacterized protein n=1 Tax=Roseivirga misakiensis TaxID=1563681 RepID=A0A1E5SZP7_9BACT|nr:hypothetical protein [Roseivirga misakiensis]OEK04604.1 hypothetical protein BFP71_14180 [Roseivirga misakiensis]